MASSQLQAADILELVFDQAFTPLPQPAKPESTAVPKDKIVAESISQAPAPVEAVAAAEGTPVESSDSWKTEYEAQVQSWRAQSADAREKSEKERLKWEATRAIEKEETAKRKASGFVDEAPAPWETSGLNFAAQGPSQASLQPSSVPAGPAPALARTPSQQDTTTDESQTWEEVTSSFPSMSFPEQIDSASPANTQPPPNQPPPSVTLAIFDSSLSKRTRLTAFFSALTVNLVLPFVNGVMLGFGEIFAKNVVMGWLGWEVSRPGSVATNVGLAGSSREQRQRQTIFR